MKALAPKKPSKNERELLILFGLIELYIEQGKPVGSHTLKENGFEGLSSATIRNYFSKLEEDGYLKQQHSSGGRIPTSAAYKLYAETHIDQPICSLDDKKGVRSLLFKETRAVATYLQRATEALSELTGCAAFLSAPRFDQDFILDIKLVSIDHHRVLCILVTDFGMIHTDVIYTEKKLSTFALKRIESYFNFRLTGLDKPALEAEEEILAATFYKEAMLRHIVNYTHFSSEDLFQAGFSKLLAYPDFNDATALANGLALFENKEQLRKLLSTCCKQKALGCWVGSSLESFVQGASACSVISIPYSINHTVCGAFGILGPNRIPYRHLYGLLQESALALSDSLTKSVYKFKISFRAPTPSKLDTHSQFLDQTDCFLLEDQSQPPVRRP